MPFIKGIQRATTKCPGITGIVCDGFYDAARSLSGLCGKCARITFLSNWKSTANTYGGVYNKSTHWFTDCFGIKTRLHGDV